MAKEGPDGKVQGKWAAEAYDFLRLYRSVQSKIYGLFLLELGWALLMLLVSGLAGEGATPSLALPWYAVDQQGSVSLVLTSRPLTEIYPAGALAIFAIWLVVERLLAVTIAPLLQVLRAVLIIVLSLLGIVLALATLPTFLVTWPLRAWRARCWIAAKEKANPESVANQRAKANGEERLKALALREAGPELDAVTTWAMRGYRRISSLLVPQVTIGLAAIESYSLAEERSAERLPLQIFSTAVMRLESQLSRRAEGYRVRLVTVPEFLRVRSTDGAARVRVWLGYDALLWGSFDATDPGRVWLNISSRPPAKVRRKSGDIDDELPMGPLQGTMETPRTLIVDVAEADDAYLALIVALKGVVENRRGRLLLKLLPDHWGILGRSLGRLLDRMMLETRQPIWRDKMPTARDFSKNRFVEQLHAWLRDTVYGLSDGERPEFDVLSQMSRTAVEIAPENPNAHYARAICLFAEDRPDLAVDAFAEGWNRDRPWGYRGWAYMVAQADLALRDSRRRSSEAVALGLAALYGHLAIELSADYSKEDLADKIREMFWYSTGEPEDGVPRTKRHLCKLANLPIPPLWEKQELR